MVAQNSLIVFIDGFIYQIRLISPLLLIVIRRVPYKKKKHLRKLNCQIVVRETKKHKKDTHKMKHERDQGMKITTAAEAVVSEVWPSRG